MYSFMEILFWVYSNGNRLNQIGGSNSLLIMWVTENVNVKTFAVDSSLFSSPGPECGPWLKCMAAAWNGHTGTRDFDF